MNHIHTVEPKLLHTLTRDCHERNDTTALNGLIIQFIFTIHLEKTSFIEYSMFRAQRRLIDPIFGSKVTFVLQIVKSKMNIIPTF